MKAVIAMALAVAGSAAFCQVNAQEVAYASTVNFEAEVNASSDVVDFLLTASDERLMNIEEGTMAWKRAGSKEIKEYAEKMMIDQRLMLGYIKKMALLRGLVLPEDVDAENSEGCDKLSGLTGRKFDKVFVKMMIEDREYDLKLFREAAESSDYEIREFAKEYIPVLEEYLERAKALKKLV